LSSFSQVILFCVFLIEAHVHMLYNVLFQSVGTMFDPGRLFLETFSSYSVCSVSPTQTLGSLRDVMWWRLVWPASSAWCQWTSVPWRDYTNAGLCMYMFSCFQL